MGTYYVSYAVDLDKLAAAWGSDDQALVRRAIKGARVDDNASWFADEIAAGAPTLDQAIRELVAGKIEKRRFSFQYIYAVEALCKALGAAVGDELKVGAWAELVLDPLLREVGAQRFDHMMHLRVPRLPMPVPRPNKQPYLTSLPLDEVNVLLGALARVEARAKTKELGLEESETLDYVLFDLRLRLRGATRRRRGLVTFLY